MEDIEIYFMRMFPLPFETTMICARFAKNCKNLQDLGNYSEFLPRTYNTVNPFLSAIFTAVSSFFSVELR